MAVEVIQLREDEREAAVLHELMEDVDLAMPVDCADRRSQFAVRGWFVFHRGALARSDVTEPT